jgi:hypothetical protein
MINSSQQSENGQEESPPPASLQHVTQASLRRRISRSESQHIFVTPSTQPAASRRITRSTVNHDSNSLIVMDLPLEAVHPTTISNSNRTFPTRRSNRIANNRAETDQDNSSIQHITPSSSIRTRRARNSTRRRPRFQQSIQKNMMSKNHISLDTFD